MDRVEIVDPRASSEVVFLRFDEKWLLDLGIDKMGMNGGPQIHLQKAPKLSKEWGVGHAAPQEKVVISEEKLVALTKEYEEQQKRCVFR